MSDEIKRLVSATNALISAVGNMKNPQTIEQVAMITMVTVGPALTQAKMTIAQFETKYGDGSKLDERLAGLEIIDGS